MTEQKQRHGCLTAWLILMIIVNSTCALVYLLGSAAIRQTIPNCPGWVFPVLAIMSVFNLVCSIALFKWKKWGFWGFCGSTAVAFVLNQSMGMGIESGIGGLFGIAALYGVLHIGKEKKGWPQLD